MVKKRNSNEQFVRDVALMHDSPLGTPVPTSNVHPLPVTHYDNQLDAFSRLRVSDPTTLFGSSSQYDDGTQDKWYHKTTGTGATSFSSNEASTNISVSANNDEVIRQTQRYIRYQTGKSQLIFITFSFRSVDSGTIKEVGYGDDDNGVFFRYYGDTGLASIILRSNRTGTPVEQEVFSQDWNIDPFDGTGLSGVTFDLTKSQIMVVDLQWLGVGRVRVGADIDGKLYYAHHFKNTNVLSGVYMSTADLPVRYRIVSTGGSGSMDCICASVSSEGGFVADLGHEHVTPNGIPGKSCPVTVETPVISIRPKALFNSITNRGEYVPEQISFFTTNNAVLLRMYRGSTLTGASWASSDTESGIEYDASATSFTGGHLTNSEFGAAASGGKAFSTVGKAAASNRIFLTLDIDGNNVDSSNFTVVGTGIGGTAVVYCNLHWTEIK